MDKENNKESNKEILMEAWIELDEIRNLTSLAVRSLEYGIKMDAEETRSIFHLLNNMTKEVIEKIKASLN